MDKKSKIDTFFKKDCNAFGKFCQNRYGKTKRKSGTRSFDFGN